MSNKTSIVHTIKSAFSWKQHFNATLIIIILLLQTTFHEIKRQKDRKTERQKDRKTERQIDTKTERQKERQNDKKTFK
jgi:hypothetical protein